MFEKLLDKLAELLWKRLEPRIIKACEEGYKRGEVTWYVSGVSDGYAECAEDITRRCGQLYEIIRQKAKEDAYTESGAINIEEVSKEEFDQIPSE